MDTGFPTRNNSAKLGEHGVDLVSRIVSDDFGWLFRRHHQELDYGIDGQIEHVTDEGAVTGQMLAVQIKCGTSFFREQNKWGYVYRGETKHFNYLANYPIPVLICICDPDTKECYWVRFKTDQVQATEAGWKITIPFENTLSSSKPALCSLIQPVVNSLDELQEYWKLNKVLVESSVVLYVLDINDVNNRDLSAPRDFFDRLRATRELSYECQGKVEFSFSGYDHDPRELYEIEEVREYVQLLSPVLPELFFFARTEEPSTTLKLFALCHADVTFTGVVSRDKSKREVEFETKDIAAFLEKHCCGLNEMTDWLKLPESDNIRITFDMLISLGFATPDDINSLRSSFIKSCT